MPPERVAATVMTSIPGVALQVPDATRVLPVLDTARLDVSVVRQSVRPETVILDETSMSQFGWMVTVMVFKTDANGELWWIVCTLNNGINILRGSEPLATPLMDVAAPVPVALIAVLMRPFALIEMEVGISCEALGFCTTNEKI